ncbi:MAG: Ribosome LSU-associated GTP-binding protein HflX [uncultured Acidimicrobiales bacterium]|uniref:GTPase HflX n=1 Tax=uncultured Acidimicrobiales bacterium TaxID=310071 RepID=A0A6J4H339_9ACTN|nr:MAG: Ribosome LSU-associated GTP-binding protein HflX [uncultured Acidimicrobiales bacterium]
MALIERSFRERIVLCGVTIPPERPDDTEAHLDELELLVDTAGADVLARVLARRQTPDPATFVGKGKAEELREVSLEVDSDTVVFDSDLSPAQQRNLEKILGRTAISRTEVILDIFAQNARTAEGRAQVELAQLRHRLPRLRGRGVAFSRQAGAMGAGGARAPIGSRGPGETQLEVDRRRLLSRMSRLEADLKALAVTRRTQAKSRARAGNRTVSIVGYTNAGKSTLLNRLTDAGVLVEDRLFATLDPKVRRLDLPGGEAVLLSDTVGFVRKLPHQLVEAFKSTLEIVTESDLLVHVVDAAGRDPDGQIEAVRTVLAEIGADHVPELVVFNKVDLLPGDAERDEDDERTSAKTLLGTHAGSLAISARTSEGVTELLEVVAGRLRALETVVELLVPYDRGDVVAALHREGEVLVEAHEDDATRIRARLDGPAASRHREFVVPSD